jgi:ubiquinone/menaquinone biosynthesis C-methylase UbiE
MRFKEIYSTMIGKNSGLDSMTLSLQDWHQRFTIQAHWTKALRLYFFDLLKTHSSDKILDIGCGTGVLLPDLQVLSPAAIYGADLSLAHLQIARNQCPDCYLSGADVYQLPFPDNTFEIVLSHFFLMWIPIPDNAIREMLRVTKNGGYLVCFAEPDYGGRLDYPTEFIKLRDYQISGLLNAGADPRMGRKLKGLFHNNKLEEIQCGVYEGYWGSSLSSDEEESEWKMLEHDLQGVLSKKELIELRKHDQSAREKGTRLIYVPTFYAWGKVVK